MKIIHDKPPNYDTLLLYFPVIKDNPNVLYCWADCIYTLSNQIISPFLIAHEEVHSRQQEGQPKPWWDKYMTDASFRYQQELEAHIVENNTASKSISDRNRRNDYLVAVARRLSSDLYGRCMSYPEALRMIRNA